MQLHHRPMRVRKVEFVIFLNIQRRLDEFFLVLPSFSARFLHVRHPNWACQELSTSSEHLSVPPKLWTALQSQ